MSRLTKTFALLLLLSGALPARAQDDDALQRVYAAIEPRIRAEYEFHLRGIAEQVLSSGAPASKIEHFQRRLKLLTYNRATLVATCIDEAERGRPPNAAPVPLGNNLMLSTCVDEKIGQLQKFSQLSAYADFFFPERVEECGERVRLPDREKLFGPYDFLALDQAKLHDFVRYNKCLMTR